MEATTTTHPEVAIQDLAQVPDLMVNSTILFLGIEIRTRPVHDAEGWHYAVSAQIRDIVEEGDCYHRDDLPNTWGCLVDKILARASGQGAELIFPGEQVSA